MVDHLLIFVRNDFSLLLPSSCPSRHLFNTSILAIFLNLNLNASLLVLMSTSRAFLDYHLPSRITLESG
uniref:Putative ovule protein n=1 Tax=Solanum chacoense TaxID=4108 RepID=A0A0V0HPQ6_SOLCH